MFSYTNNPVSRMLSDPDYYIGLVTISVNIILVIGNLIFLLINRRNERKFKLNYDLYDLTTFKALKKIIDFASKLKSTYNELKNGWQKVKSDSIKRLQLAQSKIDIILNLQKQIEHESLPMIKGYSDDLYEEINKIIQIYMDNCELLFSKFNKPDISVGDELKLDNFMQNHFSLFISEIFSQVKEHNPSNIRS